MMSLGSKLAIGAAFALMLQPALAQTPSPPSMPVGTQNPALAQPQLAAPAPVQLTPQPPAAPQPDAASPSSMIIPGGAGGLCECLINHDASLSVFDKTKMHQACLASVDACRAACNTDHYYSFVPHAVFTCPVRPDQDTGHIAMNTRPAVRLLGPR